MSKGECGMNMYAFTSEFLADGILLLDLDTTMDRRKLTIRKMRGTKHTLKPYNIAITESGF